jgi:hypothetical protein
MELRVTRPALGDVLEALLGSVMDTGDRSDPITGAGIVVTEAEVDLPLESTLVRGPNGEPLLLASPPFTMMKTGFERPARRARIVLALEEGNDT